MIKAVIFDYDETLVQTLASRIKAYQALAKNEYHFDLTEKQIRDAFGIPYVEFIKQLYGNVDNVESIIAKYQAMSKDYPNLVYDGAEEAVNSLIQKYLIGIVSGVRRKGIMLDLNRLDFPIDKFFYIQCGEDTAAQKPDPKVFDPLLIELEKRQVLPNEVVYVGDDLKDFQASIGAGFHFIGITDHTTPEEKFIEAKAPYVTNFADLEEKVSQIKNEVA